MIMKKTLITLAALVTASVAQAADNSPWDSLEQNLVDPPKATTTTLTSSFTLITVMDWDQALTENGIGGGRAFIYAIDGTNVQVALGFSFFKQNSSDSDSFQAYICQHNSSQYALGNATENGAPDVSTLGATVDYGSMTTITGYQGGDAMYFTREVYENKGKLALAISYDDDTRTFTLGALTKDNTLNYMTLQMAEGWNDSYNDYKGFDLAEKATNTVEHALWFNSALTADEIAEVAAAVVPEPATATLSLLALAGLAARRRRK